MTRTSEAAQIQIELVILFFQAELLHTGCQLLIVILTLASADDLSNSRYQAVHSCNRLSILVELHVECLDLLRIIGNKYRTLEDLLGQITLMLSLQIAAPGYLIVKLVIVLLQQLNCLGIGNASELGIQHMVQAV